MFSSLQSLQSTHICPDNKTTTHYLKTNDRIISITEFPDENIYVISLNNHKFEITIPYSSPQYKNSTSWDNTLLLDFVTTDEKTAIETANKYFYLKNLPTKHPEYA